MLSRVVFTFAIVLNLYDCHEQTAAEEKLKQFHEKWTASDIVRDIKHIKDDIEQLTNLTSEANLTTEEILFYYHRIHDFDNNNLLDGIELRGALMHTFYHSDNDTGEKHQIVTDEQLERITDQILTYDLDNDGFLSYPEMRKLQI